MSFIVTVEIMQKKIEQKNNKRLGRNKSSNHVPVNQAILKHL